MYRKFSEQKYRTGADDEIHYIGKTAKCQALPARLLKFTRRAGKLTYRCGSASGKILRKTAVLLPGPQPNNTARGENLRSAGEICKFHQAHTNCGAPRMTPTAQKEPGVRCSGGFPALSCVSKCAKPKRIATVFPLLRRPAPSPLVASDAFPVFQPAVPVKRRTSFTSFSTPEQFQRPRR